MKGKNLRTIQSILVGPVVTLFFFFLLVTFNIASAAQSEEERTAMLVEGAKKEGRVVWYTTTPVDLQSQYRKKFQEKYPFIALDIYRSSGPTLLVKVLAEIQAKRHSFDVMQAEGVHSVMLTDKGVFTKYLSPQREFYSKIFKDTEGYWTVIQFNLDTIGYNTKLVSLREVPKIWTDLLDPKWKGRLGIDPATYWWFANMLKMMGEEKGLEYFEKLSKQDMKLRVGRTLNAQMIAAGEVSIGVTVFNYAVEEMKSKGAPIEWVAFEPVVPEIYSLSISANAPHPNAARLFVDFMLSREGQEIMASTFRIPGRTDVEAIVPKLKKGINILPVDLGIARNYEKYVKLYRQVLVKR